jgi:DNA polymerase V
MSLSPNLSSGLFNVAEDYSSNLLSLDDWLLQGKNSRFFFRATGEAMAPLVLSNDVLIIDRALTPKSGDLIICSLGEDYLCRRFIRDAQGTRLVPAHPRHPTLNISRDSDFIIFGVVTGLARPFRGQAA